MRRSVIIQKIIAFALLFIFLMSTLPVSYLHTAVADHTDYSNDADHASHKDSCITRAGVNCNYHHLVVTLPFVQYEIPELAGLTINFVNEVFEYTSFVPSSFYLLNDGRGPPVIA